jgi:hypothetical protein
MGRSLFCEKDREVRSSRAIVLTAREARAANLLCQFPREARATNLLCQFPRQAAAGRRGTLFPLSLTSPNKITKKAQEPPNPKTGAKMSRSCAKLR